MKSSEYWKERFSELEEFQNAKGVACTQDVINGYNLALKELEEKIAVWYQRFADNIGISMAKARKLLTSKELKEFRWDVFEYIKHGEENALTCEWMKELENASARFHISRLEALKVQTRQILEKLYANQLSDVTNMASEVYEDGYYRSMFEMQKGFNIGFSVARLDEKKLQKVISAPWAPDGKNFSSRIWENKQKLISELQTELTRGVILGSDPQKIINNLSKKLEKSKSVTGRLVMTEQAALSARAQKECFEELDVEEFEVVETLDFKTCEQCGDMDGKHFPMSEYVIGTTVPPFHPHCRGCVCPYFDDEFDLAGQRIAKDAEGGTFYVPGDTTYKQWQQMQEEKYGAGIVAKTQKMEYNKNADIEQYERYKNLLGKNAPETFEEFRSLKYSEDWSYFKAYARSIKSGELTPLADFELYKRTSDAIDEKIVGIKTANDIVITDKAKHFISRMIGSVEQRRNGVNIEDALDALINPEEIKTIKEDEKGKSQKFKGKKCFITINPDSGLLIQGNPRKGKDK